MESAAKEAEPKAKTEATLEEARAKIKEAAAESAS